MVQNENETIKRTIKRINGYLKEFIVVLDSSGRVVNQFVQPLMVELKPRDVMQIILGASILAVPIGFTEEAWTLGETLPTKNIVYLTILGFSFVAIYVYFNFYKNHLKNHVIEFFKRVFAIYFLSLVVVGVLLTIIDKCPWGIDNALAIKRILVTGFPCTMGAAVSDTIK